MTKKTKTDQADGVRDPKVSESSNDENNDHFYDEDDIADYTDNLESFSRDKYYDLYQVENVDHHFLLTFRDAR
jgi:hypothetical protein